MPHGQHSLANNLGASWSVSSTVVSSQPFHNPFGLPLSQLLRIEKSRGRDPIKSIIVRGNRQNHISNGFCKRRAAEAHYVRPASSITSSPPPLHCDNGLPRDLKINGIEVRRDLRTAHGLHPRASRLFYRSVNTLLPSSSTVEKSRPPTVRRQPTKIVVSGARVRQPEKPSLTEIFPETPEQEKKRLFAKEQKYERKVIKPLRNLWQRFEALPQIERSQQDEEITNALIEGRDKGVMKYREHLEQQRREQLAQEEVERQKQRQQRIEDALKKFDSDHIQPLSKRISECSKAVTELRYEWLSLRKLIRRSIRNAIREIQFDASKLEQHLGQMKSNDGTHNRMRNIINSLSTNALAIAGHLTPANINMLRAQLLQRELYVERGTTVPLTETDQQSNLENPTFQVKSTRIYRNTNAREALVAMAFAHNSFSDFSEFLAAEGHRWRHLDVVVKLTSRLPEVFRWRQPFAAQYVCMNEVISTADLIYAHLLFLRGILLDSHSKIRTGDIISDALETAQKLTLSTRDFHRLYEVTFARGLTSLYPGQANFFQMTQSSVFRPFVDLILQVKEMRTEISHLLAFERLNHAKPDAMELSQFNLVSALDDISQKLDSSIRDLWQALDQAILWTGAQDLAYGRSRQPRRLGRFKSFKNGVEPSIQVVNSSSQKQELLTDRIPSWLENSSLYPPGQSVRIEFAVSDAAAAEALRKMKNSKTIAVDAILDSNISLHSASTQPRIELLIFACDNQVVILHMPRLGRNILRNFIPYFKDIVQSQSIMKVGMDMENLKELLSNNYLLDLQAYYNLDVSEKGPEHQNGSVDGDHNMISSLALRNFGSKLSGPYSTAKILSYGADDPQHYFHYLAARAYTVLQAFRATSTVSSLLHARQRVNGVISPSTWKSLQFSAVPADVGLGPVHVDSSLSNSIFRTKRDRIRYSYLAQGREKYLQSLSLSMARKALVRYFDLKSLNRRSRALLQRRYLLHLRAYYLSTVFGENSNNISKYLRLVIPPASILSIAEKAGLPLHEWHRNLLVTERRNILKAKAQSRAKDLFSSSHVMAFELTQRDKRVERESLTTYSIFHSFGFSTEMTAEILGLSESQTMSDLISSKTFLIANDTAYDKGLDNLDAAMNPLVEEVGSLKRWQNKYDVLLPFGYSGLSTSKPKPKTVGPEMDWAEAASSKEDQKLQLDVPTAGTSSTLTDANQTSTPSHLEDQTPRSPPNSLQPTHKGKLGSGEALPKAKALRYERFLRRDSRRSRRRQLTDQSIRKQVASSLRTSRETRKAATKSKTSVQK